MRVAVVGHVEWAEFLRVPRVPERGSIVHADESWAEPAGGGAVAAVQLLRLAGNATFFTALGDDALGRRAASELRALGLVLHAVFRPEPQRRAVVWVDGEGERTITVVGERMGPSADDPLPWDALATFDAVYFTSGDSGAVRAARAARTLVGTPRALGVLREAGVELDALVGSATDEGERYRPGDLEPPPRLVVRTEGPRGGSYQRPDGTGGRFEPAPLPGPVVDAYGCGDSFAAGLTFGLACHGSVAEALAVAAASGAAALTGRGAYAGQLRAR